MTRQEQRKDFVARRRKILDDLIAIDSEIRSWNELNVASDHDCRIEFETSTIEITVEAIKESCFNEQGIDRYGNIPKKDEEE